MKRLHAFLVGISRFERRFEPWFRRFFNRVFRPPLAVLIQFLKNLGRRDEGLALVEERPIADEEKHIQDIIDTMREYMRRHYQPGQYQRAGNTKTHGIVRGEVTIKEGLAPNLRHGIFAEPKTYPAWVRYSGPGPDSPRDIDDVGFLSMTIKMMGVPGPKLLDDEKLTQDLLCICTPTFVTPNAGANAQLQHTLLAETGLWYFWNFRRSHILDFWMQALWNETQRNPLGQNYFSCVPYLLGPGQAMQYSFHPLTRVYDRIPRLPLRPPDNYLHDNMVRTLGEQDVEFDIRIQLQTDPHRMPIEDASILWPERLSPRISVATLRIPKQTFDSPGQRAFAHNLSYNPWHCLPEHRPLGNQSRTRLRLYSELSRFRQQMNKTPHLEPTGAETFE